MAENKINTLPFEQLKNEPDLLSVLKLLEDRIAYNTINCVRVGIIKEYFPETRTAKVAIANKILLEQYPDGSQSTKDYAPIYAKVWFFGWGDIGITCPIKEGQEGILLFSDREIESWYINGGINPLAYARAHSITDAIFICGLTSTPNLTPTLQNCLNLFYGTKSLRIDEKGITIDGDLIVNGDIKATKDIKAEGDIVAGGISLKKHLHGNGNEGQDTTVPKG